jgi:hypothetical protein
MEINIKTTCPHCERDIKISARSQTEETKKEVDYTHEFGKAASSNVRQNSQEKKLIDEIIKNILKSKKGAPKRLVKHFFDNLGIKIGYTNDKKELAKLRTKINRSKLRVSKQVESEFNKTKQKLLKKVDKKLNKNGKKNSKKK